MRSLLLRFAKDSSGATALEYALIAMLICLAPVAAFGAGGEALAGLIGQATAELAAAGPGDTINLLPPID
jgi:Flp pilus assembly pilin Flp